MTKIDAGSCCYGAFALGTLCSLGLFASFLKRIPFKQMSPWQLKAFRWSTGAVGGVLSAVAVGAQLSKVHLEKRQKAERLLFQACQHGDIVALRSLLEERGSLEFRDREGNTPFLIAARSGFLEGLQHLQRMGANVNACNQRKETALHLAPQDEEIFQALIRIGVDINAQDADGYSVVHRLISGKKVSPTLEIVLDAEPNLELRTIRGFTTLWHATEWENSEAFSRLMEAGADTQARDRLGRTLLHVCPADWVDTLLEAGLDINAVDNMGKTPLHVAWNPDTLLELLERGADPNIRDTQGKTPLDKMVYCTDYATRARWFLKHGAEPPKQETEHV